MLKIFNQSILYVILLAYGLILGGFQMHLPLIDLKDSTQLFQIFNFLFLLLLILASGNAFFRYQGKYLSQSLLSLTLLVFVLSLFVFPRQYLKRESILRQKQSIEVNLKQLKINPQSNKKSVEVMRTAVELPLAKAQQPLFNQSDCYKNRPRRHHFEFESENYFLEQAHRDLFKNSMNIQALRWSAIQILISLIFFNFLLAHYRKP